MSTISKRNGKWRIDYRFKGQRHRIIVGRSKKKALEVLHKIEGDIINQKFHIPASKKMSFKDLADYWLENYSKISNAPSQYKKNRERIDNHLLPFFGNHDISDITPRLIDEYKRSKLDKISPATINRTLAIMRKMYNDAVRWKFVVTSPMRHVSQLHEQEKGFDFYKEDEVKKFLGSCSSDFKPIATLAVYTGMRAGEIVALKWEDVDLERKLIKVAKSGLGNTKSRKIRYVPINSKLLRVFKALAKRKKGDLVFPDSKGKMRGIDFRWEMRRAAYDAELKTIRMHDLRHTFASNFVIKGGNIVSLQKILGHSTVNMTMRYAHLSPDFMAQEIESLDFETDRSQNGHQKELVN